MDFSILTSSVAVGGIVTGLLAAGAAMILPRIARMGVNWIKASLSDSMTDEEYDEYRRRYGE